VSGVTSNLLRIFEESADQERTKILNVAIKWASGVAKGENRGEGTVAPWRSRRGAQNSPIKTFYDQRAQQKLLVCYVGQNWPVANKQTFVILVTTNLCRHYLYSTAHHFTFGPRVPPSPRKKWTEHFIVSAAKNNRVIVSAPGSL